MAAGADLFKSLEDEVIEITRICAVKKREKLRVADLVWGLDTEGKYLFNMNNIEFYATDRYDRAYSVDRFGDPHRIDSANFDEEMVIDEAESFKELTEKLDRRIQKRLVWIEEPPAIKGLPPQRICMGIR